MGFETPEMGKLTPIGRTQPGCRKAVARMPILRLDRTDWLRLAATGHVAAAILEATDSFGAPGAVRARTVSVTALANPMVDICHVTNYILR